MTPDEIQKDRAAGTIDLSPDRIEELAKWLTVDDSNDLPMSGKDSRAIALILRTLTAENAALKERVATDYFGTLVAKARIAAAKASVKFPQPNYVTLKIAEEAGEVVRGAVHYAEGRMDWSEVEGEIVQLLAMLMRFVTDGDQINGITPPHNLGKTP